MILCICKLLFQVGAIMHTSELKEALNYAPLRKTLRRLHFAELFMGYFI